MPPHHHIKSSVPSASESYKEVFKKGHVNLWSHLLFLASWIWREFFFNVFFFFSTTNSCYNLYLSETQSNGPSVELESPNLWAPPKTFLLISWFLSDNGCSNKKSKIPDSFLLWSKQIFDHTLTFTLILQFPVNYQDFFNLAFCFLSLCTWYFMLIS